MEKFIKKDYKYKTYPLKLRMWKEAFLPSRLHTIIINLSTPNLIVLTMTLDFYTFYFNI